MKDGVLDKKSSLGADGSERFLNTFPSIRRGLVRQSGSCSLGSSESDVMFSSLFGVPAHPLVVHVVVVFVPLAALAGLAVAVWPAARRRYAPWALAIATVALVSIPLATHTGEELQSQVPASPLVREHAHMGDQLLPFAGLLWLALVVLVAADLAPVRRRLTGAPLRIVAVGAAVLAVAASLASGVQAVRIGHSGAKAAWHGVSTSGTSARGR